MIANAAPLWVAWAEQSLLAFRAGPGGVERSALARPAGVDYRYQAKLFVGDGHLLLRSGSEEGTNLDVSADGTAFLPVGDVPDALASLPVGQVRVAPTGTVSGIDREANLLLLWAPSSDLRIRTPPPDFVVHDLTEALGHLWICGSVPSGRLRSAVRRAAYARSGDDGASWQVDDHAHGGLRAAWWSLLSGAMSSYTGIHVLGANLVLFAEAGDLGEESSILFVRTPVGRWHSKLVKHDLVRAVLDAPSGGVYAVSHNGSLLENTEGGWHGRELGARVLALTDKHQQGEPRRDLRVEVLDAQALNGRILAVASLRVPGGASSGSSERVGEAVIELGQGQARLVAWHSADEPEIVSAAWAGG